jgi:hypothetical protein
LKQDERPKSEKKLGLFYSPSMQGDGGFLVPMNPLTAGPGEPGPEDEWHVPPAGEPAAETPEDERHMAPPRKRAPAKEPVPAPPKAELTAVKTGRPRLRDR